MSQNSECFAKTKVRFRHISDTAENGINIKTEKSVRRNLPKVKSIVPLKKSVKIVNLNAKQNATDQTLENNKKEENSILEHDSVQFINKCEPLNDTTNVENIKANFGSQTNFSEDQNFKIVPPLVLPSTLNHSNYEKTSKATEKTNKEISKSYVQHNMKKGKENKNMIKDINLNSIRTSSFSPKISDTHRSNLLKSDRRKIKTHNSSDSTKEEKRSSNTFTTNKLIKKSSNIKLGSIDLMPCHKYTKTTAKNKDTVVKKSVVRDILCNNKNVQVDSGVIKQKSTTECDLSDKSKNVCTKSHDMSAEKLAKPKYNSIMCTINKLNEVKKEKVVTDIEHLPMSYKSLINGKISNALDFPLNEAIYKNLVDLSIDNTQLPSRRTRSKDPEPRQKDLVPQLSDFFKPEYEDEYCIPVHVKPRSSEIRDHWNAFRISDKISEWKSKMDSS